MKYKLDEKLKVLPLLLYGLQWWVVAAPAIVVMGLVVAKLHFGSDVAAQIVYMQKLFLIVGLTMGVQILGGHKLPVVTGPASVLLVGILASMASGINAIYTAVFIGGVFITLLALSGLLKHVAAIFTNRVIVVIMLLIPFTLMPTILRLIFQSQMSQVVSLSFAFAFILFLLIVNKLLKGVWKSTTLIWGIIVGSLVVYGIVGFPQYSNYTTVEALPSLFIKPEFDAGTILAFIFCAIVLIINQVGSVQAVGQLLNADNMPKRNKRGVAISGIFNMVSGFTGVIGSVDFTTSTGIIASTRCASRFAFIPAAILLVLCSFSSQFISIILHIPGIVMGTMLLYIMSMQLAAGVQMINNKGTIRDFNDCTTIGLPILVAIIISFAPAEAVSQIPSILRPVYR